MPSRVFLCRRRSAEPLWQRLNGRDPEISNIWVFTEEVGGPLIESIIFLGDNNLLYQQEDIPPVSVPLLQPVLG